MGEKKRPIRIAVNTRLMIKGKLEGIGTFTREIFSRVAEKHPEAEFLFLFDRPFDKGFICQPNIRGISTGLPARHAILYYLWFEYFVPRVLEKQQADLFISTDGYLSLGSETPQIQVLHDLNFEKRKFGIPASDLWYYRKFFPKYAKKATRIVTVSEFSKEDIASTYGIPYQKIGIVPNAASVEFRPLEMKEKDKYMEKISGGLPYFFYSGSLNPRKNLGGLIQAFEKMKESTGSLVKLVIAGGVMFKGDGTGKNLENLKHQQDIVFTGHLSREDMALATGSAFCAINVSLYEGFGIPVVEAMQCGVPVICSATTGLGETGKGAACLVNPENMEEVSQAMEKVWLEPEFRQTLSENGLKRAGDFSWDQSADKMWENIEKALGLK